MIAFSQTTELAQLATINVAAPKTAEPSDGSGAAFLQTIYELSTAAIPSQPTNVAPPEERGLVGQTLAIDETKTSLEDCQPDPQSVLGYVQLPFVLPSPTTAPFTFSMVQPQQYGPEDTKLLLDQNAVVPTSNTQKAGSADISDEAFDSLLEVVF